MTDESNVVAYLRKLCRSSYALYTESEERLKHTGSLFYVACSRWSFSTVGTFCAINIFKSKNWTLCLTCWFWTSTDPTALPISPLLFDKRSCKCRTLNAIPSKVLPVSSNFKSFPCSSKMSTIKLQRQSAQARWYSDSSKNSQWWRSWLTRFYHLMSNTVGPA